jgi:hypothetical protein
LQLTNKTENRMAVAITDVFFHDVLQLSLRKAMIILLKAGYLVMIVQITAC